MICRIIKKYLCCFLPNNEEPYQPMHIFKDETEVETLLNESTPSVHWIPRKSIVKDSLLEMTPIDSVNSFNNYSSDTSSSSSDVEDDDLFYSCFENEEDENENDTNMTKSIDFFNSVTEADLITTVSNFL